MWDELWIGWKILAVIVGLALPIGAIWWVTVGMWFTIEEVCEIAEAGEVPEKYQRWPARWKRAGLLEALVCQEFLDRKREAGGNTED